MAGLGGAFGGLLGNSILQQIVLYQVVGSLISAALGPYLQALANQVNQVSPLAPLSPADAADAVLRNVWGKDAAAHEASFSGVNRERFEVLARLAGNAPDPGSLAIALRRELISADRYLEGIRQGRLRDEWADTVRELSVQEPGPEAPLQALLQGQLPEGRARALFERFGGDPQHFDWLFDTQGQAPTPTQALELANRGIIPWDGEGPDAVSFRQAFLEGPWRNKWEPVFRALGEYLPPPRTVTAMYKEGSISRERAIELLQKQGLATDLAAAYVTSGSDQKTEPTKQLAQSTVLQLYRDQLVDRELAGSMLQSLGYDATEADFVLQVADLQVTQRYLDSAVSRIHTLYAGRKIDQATATAVLAELQLAPANIEALIGIWSWERAANVLALTPAQLAAAYKKGIIEQGEAQTRLEAAGFLPHDAWLYLSQSAGGALPDEPPRTAPAIGS